MDVGLLVGVELAIGVAHASFVVPLTLVSLVALVLRVGLAGLAELATQLAVLAEHCST